MNWNGGNRQLPLTWSGSTVSWYDGEPAIQLNASGGTYLVAAFCIKE